jgi:hypothetical protein
LRQDRPFLKEASNASARPGAQHSLQAIERGESTLSDHADRDSGRRNLASRASPSTPQLSATETPP